MIRKTIAILSIITTTLLVDVSTGVAQTENTVTPQGDQWTRSESGTWQGKLNETTYWYKSENGKINSTSDKKTWAAVNDNRWMGFDGKWYEMTGNDVLWSSDGKVWTTTGDRVWRGSDGTWYMFDSNWVLWTGGNGTLPPSTVNKNK